VIPLPYPTARGLAVAGMLAAAVVGIVVAFKAGSGEPRRRWLQVCAMLVVALAFRAALSLVVVGSPYDVFHSFRFVGDRLRQGGDIFVPPWIGLSNYPPLIYWWWAAAASIVPNGHDQLFAAVVRAPFWCLDAAIAPVLLLLRRDSVGLRAGWIYALNPVAAAVPTLHGQFDAVVALPLLLATATIARRPLRGGLLVGLAAAVKPWPLYFALPLLALLPSGRRLVTVALVAVAPALVFAVYGVIHPEHLGLGILRVAIYVSHWQGLGMGFLIPDHAALPVLAAADLVAAAGTLGAGFLMARWGASAAEVVGVSALVLITLAPGVSDQYMAWPFPFLLLAGRLRGVAAVTAGVLPAILWIDLWFSQNQGSPMPLLYFVSTLSTGLLAGRILLQSRRASSGLTSRRQHAATDT
jgi:hypothetical protein